MKKIIFISSSLILLCMTLTCHSKENSSKWLNEDAPYEITIGTELITQTNKFSRLLVYDATPENSLMTKTLRTPSFNAGFSYKLNKLIVVGAIGTFTQYNYTKSSTYNNSILEQHRFKYLSIAPRVRIDWFNRKHISLYSSLALGLSYIIDNEVISKEVNTYAKCFYEVTFIGVKAGAKVFGFADLSISNSGYLRVGVGYNFNSKK